MSWSLWLLGYPDQAVERMVAALQRAASKAIKQGLSKCSVHSERCFEAELHRLKALEMHLSNKLDATVDRQALLNRALAIAKSQNARSLELRAARDLLAPIYEWFTEGFETPDLKEAKALLEQLKP